MKKSSNTRAILLSAIFFASLCAVTGRTQSVWQDRSDEILRKSLQASQSINDPLLKAMALMQISASCAKVGQKGKAERIVSQMIQISQSIDSAHYKAVDLANIAGIYIEAGQREKGLDLLSQALRIAKTEQEDYLRNHVLAEIAIKYVAAKEFDQALLVADGLDASTKAITLAGIAVKYVESNSRR